MALIAVLAMAVGVYAQDQSDPQRYDRVLNKLSSGVTNHNNNRTISRTNHNPIRKSDEQARQSEQQQQQQQEQERQRNCSHLTSVLLFHYQGLSFQPRTNPMPKHQSAATSGFARAYILKYCTRSSPNSNVWLDCSGVWDRESDGRGVAIVVAIGMPFLM
jgi:hypothetical protein